MTEKSAAEHETAGRDPSKDTGKTESPPADQSRTQDLAKAGRKDFDPNAGQE
ncbi:MAG: hypothetical protein ACRYFW_04125 [Janthinobacterium lividum]